MKIEEIRAQQAFFARLEGILLKVPGNETEAIFQKYIETKRTADVADHLNKLGCRIRSKRGERLWINTDVTAILDDPAAVDLVDPEIYDLVKVMQRSRRLSLKSFDQGG